MRESIVGLPFLYLDGRRKLTWCTSFLGCLLHILKTTKQSCDRIFYFFWTLKLALLNLQCNCPNETFSMKRNRNLHRLYCQICKYHWFCFELLYLFKSSRRKIRFQINILNIELKEQRDTSSLAYTCIYV